MANFTIKRCGTDTLSVHSSAHEQMQRISADIFIVINTIFALATILDNGLAFYTIITSKVLKQPTYILMGILCLHDGLVGLVLQPLMIASVSLSVFF